MAVFHYKYSISTYNHLQQLERAPNEQLIQRKTRPLQFIAYVKPEILNPQTPKSNQTPDPRKHKES